MSVPRHRADHGRVRRVGRRAELARDWQEWAIENLLLGAAPALVKDRTRLNVERDVDRFFFHRL